MLANNNGLVSLKKAGCLLETEFIRSGKSLGAVVARFRADKGPWLEADTREEQGETLEVESFSSLFFSIFSSIIKFLFSFMSLSLSLRFLLSIFNFFSSTGTFLVSSKGTYLVSSTLNSFLLTIPIQFIAYHVALLKNCDIDKPRNLAKSVTVE